MNKYLLGFVCLGLLACGPKPGNCYRHKTEENTFAQVDSISQTPIGDKILYYVANYEGYDYNGRYEKDFLDRYESTSCSDYAIQLAKGKGYQLQNKIEDLEKSVDTLQHNVELLFEKKK